MLRSGADFQKVREESGEPSRSVNDKTITAKTVGLLSSFQRTFDAVTCDFRQPDSATDFTTLSQRECAVPIGL